MARALTNDEILALIEREERSAYGYYNGTLSEERQTALDYYLGEAFPDDEFIPEGRSRAISTDVADTIEWILPQLLKIFLSGEEVIKFMPISAEDVKPAEQETAFVNNTVTQKNEAFATFYSWFKTALIQKMGYVKAWYEEKEDVTTERYEDLTDEEFQMLLSDDDLEPTEHEEKIEEVEQIVTGPDGQPMPMMVPVKKHTVTIRKNEKCGEVRISAVPPEELFISTTHRDVSLKDASFVEHRTKKTISYIRELGYDIPDDIADNSDTDTEEENRDQYEEFKNDDDVTSSAMRQVWLRDIYMRIDANGDGIAEMQRFLVVGKRILDKMDWDVIPFAALCPVPMPNRHVGLSYADLIMDLQEIKSMLLRQVLDNGYLAINGRYAVSDRVNLDDMLVSRPGGVVRVEGEPGANIMPLTHPQTSMMGVQLLEYADSIKEGRTGITKYTQGMDSNSLNKTATGITQIMQMAQARIELIARLFAEGGVKDLFSLVHGLLSKHEKSERIFELNKEWVPVNPREWKKRNDMMITVGIGTGNKDQQLMHLGNMFQMAMAPPVMGSGVVSPVNIYNILSELAKNAGFKDTAKFFTDPSQQPPQPPQPPPEVLVEQMKQQGKQQELQVKMQMDSQKMQADMQQEQLRSQNDVAIERDKLQMQAELEKYKAQLQAETELQKTKMQLEAEIQIEKFRAQNDAALEMQKQRMELNSIVDKASQAQGNEATGTIVQGLKAMIQSMNAPKQVVRDESGRVVGVQTGNAE